MTDPIVGYLEGQLESYLDDLRHLAGIDSGTYNKQGVDEVLDWFEVNLRAQGFETKRNAQTDWGNDLIARLHGTGRGRVLLIGHADTVYPDGTAAARPVTVDGDTILGPGTCDMKAGLLTGLYAVRALKEAGWADFETITVIIVSDEEIETRHSA